MKILILGGTIFIGRHIAETALARGHTVTIFNRGKQQSLNLDIEYLVGDRHTDINALQNRNWDVVIDTSGYVPSAVETTAKTFASNIDNYIYISSLSVYGAVTSSVDENTPVKELEKEKLAIAETLSGAESPTAFTYGQYYGPLKVNCEKIVQHYFPNRHLIARPGVVVGSYDYTNRLTYWIERLKNLQQFLAPNTPETPLRILDVNDLADWLIKSAEQQRSGIYNLPGQDNVNFGKLFAVINQHLNKHALPIWVGESYLLEAKVKPWLEIPLWLSSDLQGMLRIGDLKAINSGFKYRPLIETIANTTAWLENNNPEYKILTGMAFDLEEKILEEYQLQKSITL